MDAMAYGGMNSRISQPTRREFLAYGSAAAASGTAGTAAVAAGGTPLQFMVIGDWGRDGAFHQRQVAAAMGQFPDSQFVVTTGDNFYQHGVASVRDPKWDTSFNRIYTNVPQRWYAVLGNHDYGGSVEAQIERSFHDPRWRRPS
jgi:acid phosphatase